MKLFSLLLTIMLFSHNCSAGQIDYIDSAKKYLKENSVDYMKYNSIKWFYSGGNVRVIFSYLDKNRAFSPNLRDRAIVVVVSSKGRGISVRPLGLLE
jgi:hypothetical protein